MLHNLRQISMPCTGPTRDVEAVSRALHLLLVSVSRRIIFIIMCSSCGDSYPIPVRRDFRRRMKHLTRRKTTAVQRIEMNRFWNELEEISYRLEEARIEYEEQYCTIEEAQNKLNETFEWDNEVEAAFANGVVHDNECWCKQHTEGVEEENESSYWSDDDDDGSSDTSDDDDFDEDDGYVSFNNDDEVFSHTFLPHPPSLKDTRKLLAMLERDLNLLV